MNPYQEKLRSIGVSVRRGTSERKRVTDERDGSAAGYETEHWNDSQDAVGILKTAHVKAKRVTLDPRKVQT